MRSAAKAVKRVKFALTTKFGDEGERATSVRFFEDAYELSDEDRRVLQDTANMVTVLQRSGILTPRSALMLMWAIGVEMGAGVEVEEEDGTQG